jgi:hypothetical protein
MLFRQCCKIVFIRCYTITAARTRIFVRFSIFTLKREFHFQINQPKALIQTFVPDIEVLTVDVGPELRSIVSPVGTDDGGVELRSDINIYWGLMVIDHRGGCMEKNGKRRDEKTGKEESALDSFTNQIRKFRAAHDSTSFMNGEETAEEAEERKRKKSIQDMVERGIR